jgi:hypothetical protein
MVDRNDATMGKIGWLDLTVPDAASVRDFYREVVGWRAEGVDMGGYEDFVLRPAAGGDEPVAGICHARGANAELPPVWLPYFLVDDLEASIARCSAGGGQTVTEIRTSEAQGRFVVIQDPEGAYCALFEPSRPHEEGG